MLLWEYAEPILVLLDQPEDIVRLSGVYIRRTVFGLWPMMGFEATRRFLQCQGIARPVAVVAVVSDALHPLWNWVLIYELGYGFEGAGAASLPPSSAFPCPCLYGKSCARRLCGPPPC